MIRAAGRLLLIGILLATIVGTAAAAPDGQSGALLPAIADFSADPGTVSYADVEAGTAQVTLTWHTLNTSAQYMVTLENYYQNYWVSTVDPDTALPLNGSQQVTVMLPQNFGVPTYRLTLKTNRGEIIGQQFVTLAYSTADQAAPSIVVFTTKAQSVDTNLILQSNARLVMSWQIANRQPDTLIRFDEVMPDGSVVPAEPPRRSLWLPSQGESTLIPQVSASKDDLHFRMTLVSLRDGSVYAQQELIVPVIGSVVMAPSQPTVQQTSGNQPHRFTASQPNISGSQITNFSAELAEPGGTVTLHWDAGSDVQSVDLLEQNAGDGPTTLYIQLPPSGSLDIPLSPDSSGVTYTLRVHSDNGEVSTGQVSMSAPSDQGGGG